MTCTNMAVSGEHNTKSPMSLLLNTTSPQSKRKKAATIYSFSLVYLPLYTALTPHILWTYEHAYFACTGLSKGKKKQREIV